MIKDMLMVVFMGWGKKCKFWYVRKVYECIRFLGGKEGEGLDLLVVIVMI